VYLKYNMLSIAWSTFVAYLYEYNPPILNVMMRHKIKLAQKSYKPGYRVCD
jgi:hypothetical protein